MMWSRSTRPCAGGWRSSTISDGAALFWQDRSGARSDCEIPRASRRTVGTALEEETDGARLHDRPLHTECMGCG